MGCIVKQSTERLLTRTERHDSQAIHERMIEGVGGGKNRDDDRPIDDRREKPPMQVWLGERAERSFVDVRTRRQNVRMIVDAPIERKRGA